MAAAAAPAPLTGVGWAGGAEAVPPGWTAITVTAEGAPACLGKGFGHRGGGGGWYLCFSRGGAQAAEGPVVTDVLVLSERSPQPPGYSRAPEFPESRECPGTSRCPPAAEPGSSRFLSRRRAGVRARGGVPVPVPMPRFPQAGRCPGTDAPFPPFPAGGPVPVPVSVGVPVPVPIPVSRRRAGAGVGGCPGTGTDSRFPQAGRCRWVSRYRYRFPFPAGGPVSRRKRLLVRREAAAAVAVLELRLSLRGGRGPAALAWIGEMGGFSLWCRKGPVRAGAAPGPLSGGLERLSLRPPGPPPPPSEPPGISGPSAMDGIPFALHPKFGPGLSSPILAELTVKSLADIEREYSYGFLLERTAAARLPPGLQ
ncbi:multivesicular body subunit 12A isoform X1 [Corvus hawaiiensis]|uniref:multivesicular body subunit 12A isoform X1 n=1 Tax=Corvus hawaiiensis TaxID=134902 RepID=UPI00201862F5|nr:multivesicular body subunit 12A isoform X1 [Corvus hawaiiensis]